MQVLGVLMKYFLFTLCVLSTTVFSQDIFLCTALCGMQKMAEERPKQGLNLTVIQASSFTDSATAYKNLQKKCEKATLYHGLSAFVRNLGTNSIGADGVFAYDKTHGATEANSCIKLGE
jgi:hypothetical protein